MQGYVGSLVTTLLQIYSSKRILKIGYQESSSEKKIVNRLRFDRIMLMSMVCSFLPTL